MTGTVKETGGGGFFGLWGGKKETTIVDTSQKIKDAIFDNLQFILLSCLKCWNETDLYKVRDLFLTRLGVFPYHRADETRMVHKICGNQQEVRTKINPNERTLDRTMK